MTALDISATKYPRRPAKILQICRHRVVRWFRPSEAAFRRQRLEPHPLPSITARELAMGKEERHERPA